MVPQRETEMPFPFARQLADAKPLHGYTPSARSAITGLGGRRSLSRVGIPTNRLYMQAEFYYVLAYETTNGTVYVSEGPEEADGECHALHPWDVVTYLGKKPKVQQLDAGIRIKIPPGGMVIGRCGRTLVLVTRK